MAMTALYNGDCLEVMAGLESASVDLTVTSPPYDNLRTYNDSLNDWTPAKWQAILAELYRVTKVGGVVMWNVGDATIDGSETGTSFRQALHAMECGFNLHDTMIYKKRNYSSPGAQDIYIPAFEYMFVFSVGRPAHANMLKDRPNAKAGQLYRGGGGRNKDGSLNPTKLLQTPDFGKRINIWEYAVGGKDIGHPAVFPIEMATDHILSWSNPGDMVLDPFLGSGTTGVAALRSGRRFIGIERDPEYFQIATKRIAAAQPRLVIDLSRFRAEMALQPQIEALRARLSERVARV